MRPEEYIVSFNVNVREKDNEHGFVSLQRIDVVVESTSFADAAKKVAGVLGAMVNLKEFADKLYYG